MAKKKEDKAAAPAKPAPTPRLAERYEKEILPYLADKLGPDTAEAYATMSDDDLAAVIGYLRTVPPVDTASKTPRPRTVRRRR